MSCTNAGLQTFCLQTDLPLVRKLQEQTGLSDTLVANDDKLEEILTKVLVLHDSCICLHSFMFT